MVNLKISIELVTFNGARFLQEQLASLAAQTSFPAELVVIDDGSNDENLAILEYFSYVSSIRVSVLRNDYLLGYDINFLKVASLFTGT